MYYTLHLVMYVYKYTFLFYISHVYHISNCSPKLGKSKKTLKKIGKLIACIVLLYIALYILV